MLPHLSRSVFWFYRLNESTVFTCKKNYILEGIFGEFSLTNNGFLLERGDNKKNLKNSCKKNATCFPFPFSFWCIPKAVQHPTQNRHTISSKYLYFYTRSGSCVNWALYYTVFVYKHVWKVKAGNSCSACHRLWTIILDVSRAFKYCTCKDFLRMYVISMQFVMHSPWKLWKS